jgi:hypothetical protein
MIDHIKLVGTTDAAEAATITATILIHATLRAVEWIDGDLADGVDAVLSFASHSSGVSRTLLTLTDANSDAWYFPHEIAHDNAGAAVTLDGTNEMYVPPIIFGTLSLAIANGGVTKTGGCIVYFEP